jgi:hypothetical protein
VRRIPSGVVSAAFSCFSPRLRLLYLASIPMQ